MTNISGASSGSSTTRRGRVVGVPMVCWCGAEIVGKISKSDPNPYRRYFRCAFAVSNKLMDDNHVFKWVDEALLNEVDRLSSEAKRLEQMVRESEIVFDGAEYEKMVFDKVLMKVEEEVFQKVESVVSESQRYMKKPMVVGIVVRMIVVGLGNFI
ncbi:hypothetical protein V5N11_001723 [Cardamine amara subsp. amara]|uniref:GRF-type domain-containing protein n=1 Tax=Cardamine amara subsp. amara TaxID=228776 RepID=A0ABD0Z0R2_CARAN